MSAKHEARQFLFVGGPLHGKTLNVDARIHELSAYWPNVEDFDQASVISGYEPGLMRYRRQRFRDPHREVFIDTEMPEELVNEALSELPAT